MDKRYTLLKNIMNKKFDVLIDENDNLKIKIAELQEMNKQNRALIERTMIQQDAIARRNNHQFEQTFQMLKETQLMITYNSMK